MLIYTCNINRPIILQQRTVSTAVGTVANSCRNRWHQSMLDGHFPHSSHILPNTADLKSQFWYSQFDSVKGLDVTIPENALL